MLKIKSKNLFLKKIAFGIFLFVFSITVFANDGKAIKNNNTTVKVEPVRFVGDGIVSGKQQAINRTNAIFNYSDNSIYEIYSKVDYITTIRLQEGEKILFFAGGDTERWAIEETQGGKNNRPLVFIKPNIEDDFDEMSTNINIVTDKHVYFLNIYLSTDKYNPLVEWNYPNERKIIIEAQERNTTSIGTDDLTMLNYNYSWDKKGAIAPIQVFDNGDHTFLVMKDNFKEMPAIYVKDVDKQISLVTPKINGKYITIDRITSEVILELGKTKLKIYNRKK
jgi:conjugal transfer protein trbG/virB9/cagX